MNTFFQLNGTAMGTVFAPTYVNLSMEYNEIKISDIIEANYNIHTGHIHATLKKKKFLFLDTLMTKIGEKIRMNIHSKSTVSIRYVSHLSNHPKPCLKNIPFCLLRCTCTIVENENVRHTKLKELRTILKAQKYPQMVIEKGIGKAFAISQEQRRAEKLKNIDDILPFGSKYNPNSSNVFPNI